RDLGVRGWDRAYGWGAVDVAAALREPEPLHDPLEPNDDIRWVSGRAGFAPDRPLLRRARRAEFAARLDLQKDQFDIYPVWLAPGDTGTVTVTARDVHVDLYVWQPAARSAIGSSQVVTFSRRRGAARESVEFVNDAGRGLTGYVEVRGVRGGALGGTYRITMTRR
ncbi:MAG: hypothetical protein AB1416_13775, partial [Actinomycetota bacterium]